ncbi:hypothetical protein BGZ82_003437 [Podila clonocystis]|nr:hypothetical protein BGZ82_003437 [Podila clonocystis]
MNVAAMSKAKRWPLPEPESPHKKLKSSTSTSSTDHLIQQALGHLSTSRQELKGVFRTLGQVPVDTFEDELVVAKTQLKKGLMDMKRTQLALEESCLVPLKVRQEQKQDVGVGGSSSGERNSTVRVNTVSGDQEAEDNNSNGNEIWLKEQQVFDTIIETELKVFLARVQGIREARRQTRKMKNTALSTATIGSGSGSGRSVVPVVASDPETEINNLRMLCDALVRGDELERELDISQRQLIKTRQELRQVTERLKEVERQAGALQEVRRGEIGEMRDKVRAFALEVIDAQADLNWAKDRLEDLEYALDEKELSGAELQEAHWTLRWTRDELKMALEKLQEAHEQLEDI